MEFDGPASTRFSRDASRPAATELPENGARVPGGVLDSLRGMADSVFGTVRDRVELFAIEVQEEKNRLVRTVVWCVAFVFSSALAIAFISLAVVVACWDTAARVPVVVGLAMAYTAVAGWTGWKLRAWLAAQPLPFAASLDELNGDRACVQPKE